jgi:hypothetical protein
MSCEGEKMASALAESGRLNAAKAAATFLKGCA